VTGISNEDPEYCVLVSRWHVWFEDCVVVAEGQLLTAPIGWETLLLRVLEVWRSDLCPDADIHPEVSSPAKMQPAVFVVLLRPSGSQYLNCDSSLRMLCS